jgi:hypothetical protein
MRTIVGATQVGRSTMQTRLSDKTIEELVVEMASNVVCPWSSKSLQHSQCSYVFGKY